MTETECLRKKLEREIERPAHDFAKRNGWIAVKMMRTSVNGFPDHFFARGGRIVLIEFKAPGESPSRQQSRRHKDLREHGCEVFVVDSLDAAKEILK